jgi:hypothetical protein
MHSQERSPPREEITQTGLVGRSMGMPELWSVPPRPIGAFCGGERKKTVGEFMVWARKTESECNCARYGRFSSRDALHVRCGWLQRDGR